MKACAIVAEYNPFHNGHAWQLQEVKKQTGADCLVIIMSGNFVQRGDLALVDKWIRTEMALANGADLVVELPTYSAVQAADIFGAEAIKIAGALGCHYLAFGAESGSAQDFLEMAQTLEKTAIPKDRHLSYHEQVKQAVEHQAGSFLVDKANTILGLAYTRAIIQQGLSIEIIPIQRQVVEHSEQVLQTGKTIASATAIRRAVRNEQADQVGAYVPANVASRLSQVQLQDPEQIWPLLRYRLKSASLEDLRAIYQMEEGIEHRLKEAVYQAESFAELVEQVKNKRWRPARVQRLCFYVLLNMQKKQVEAYLSQQSPSIRVLGFNQKGNAYLKEQADLNYFTQFKKRYLADWQAQIAMDSLYQDFAKEEQSFRRVIQSEDL